MGEISKHRQSEEAAWKLLDAERQATKRLREQVAAQAAVIESLKSALRSCYSDWNGDTQVQHFNIGLVYEALSLATNSTQILDDVRRAERERCAKVCDAVQKRNEDNGLYLWEAEHSAAAIRAME